MWYRTSIRRDPPLGWRVVRAFGSIPANAGTHPLTITPPAMRLARRASPLLRAAAGGLVAGWLAAALLALGGAAAAQTFERFGTEDGLVSSLVTNVAQDPLGFLWIGTSDGLCRFDGVAFACYRHVPDDPTSLAANEVWGGALLVDRAGRLWVGTAGGLQVYDADADAFRALEGDALPEVKALVEAEDGTLWVGTIGGLFRVAPGARRVEKAGLPDDVIGALAVDASGALWVGTMRGVRRLTSNGFEAVTDTSARAFTLWPAGRGAVLVGTVDAGLWHVAADGATRRVPLPDGASRVLSIGEAADGTLWVGTWGGGLLQLDASTYAVLARHRPRRGDPEALPSERVTDTFVDADAGTWVATWDGLARLIEPSPFAELPAPDDASPTSTAIAGGPGGRLWIGTADGVYGVDPGAPTEGAYPVPRPWAAVATGPASPVRALAPDPDGGVWVGTETTGLFYLDPETGTLERRQARLPDQAWIHALLLDRQGRLWVTTVNLGVCVVAADRTTTRCFDAETPAPHALPTNETYALAETADGAVWVGTLGHGVLRVAPDLSRIEPRGAAVPALARARVVALEAAPGGVVWAGTFDGLFRLDPDGRVDAYGPEEGLPHPTVGCVQRDAEGHLWLSTGAGLAALDPETGRVARYGSADNLPPLSPFFGTCDAHADALWIGTRTGVVGFDPDRVRTADAPPSTLITAVQIDGEAVARMQERVTGVRVPARAQQLTIDFVGIDHRRPEGLRYAYRLDGVHDDWVGVGGERRVTFPRLQPGRYTFRVRATSGLGVVGTREAQVTFAVRAPFWRQAWFLALVTALLGALAYAAHRYHLHRALDVERARHRIASDLHDDLGSQIAAVTMQLHRIRTRAPAATRAALERCEHYLQQLSTSLRDLVWVVGADHDTLGDLVGRIRDDAFRLLPDHEIEVQAEGLPDDLPLAMEARKHLYLFCKEALHNTAKHAQASSVRVRVALTPRHLTLDIADDGVGLPAGVGEDAANPLLQQGDGLPSGRAAARGHGLRSMRDRARALGGTLTTEGAPGGGVRHRLTVSRDALAAERRVPDAELARSRDGSRAPSRPT